MKKTLPLILVIAFAFAGTAMAAKLPSYYPAKGFQRTGIIDAVYLDESRVVIGDISYVMSSSVVVHSLTSYRDSVLRVRKGAKVGFKMDSGRVITEFWMLPRNYEAPRRR